MNQKKWLGFSDERNFFGVVKIRRTSWKGHFLSRQLPGQIWKEIGLAGNKKNGILNVLWYLYGSLALSDLDTRKKMNFYQILPMTSDWVNGKLNGRITAYQAKEELIVAENDM